MHYKIGACLVLTLTSFSAFAAPLPRDSPYFIPAVTVTTIVAMLLGFMIGSTFALILTSLAGENADPDRNRKAIKIGGIAGSLLAVLTIYIFVIR